MPKTAMTSSSAPSMTKMATRRKIFPRLVAQPCAASRFNIVFAGLVEAEWKESENGRMAKFYSLTRAGRKQLAGELEQWQRYTRSINWVLDSQ